MLTIAFVLLSLNLLAATTPVDRGQRGDNRIWLRKTSTVPGKVKETIVNIEQVLAQLFRTYDKYRTGFDAYLANTGSEHPLSKGFHLISPHSLDFNTTRRATGSDLLSDESNGLFWKGSITVGNPAQTFTVDFDTGSSDLFLPGPKCDSSCSGHAIYDPSTSSASSDQHKTYTLRYGDGSSVTGEEYTDTMSIAGITATNQALGASDTYSRGFSSSQFSADGLLGMAYQSISVYNSSPPFQSMVAQGQVDQPVFSFKLAPSGSELFLGGINENMYTGPITYVPVKIKAYWQVTLDTITADGSTAASYLRAIIDTGTTYILGDNANVEALYALIPGSRDASDVIGPGFYTFPCDSEPDVSFTFGGTAFTISPNLFNLGRLYSGSNDCVGAVIGRRQSFWIMGDTFLQGVYSIFDLGNDQVGFATLK